MPGEATIGALRVVLGADTAKFEDNLKSAIGSLEDFGKKALTIATGIQLSNIFEQAFRGVVESITGAIDAADKLSKASSKFGIPAEELAALSNAASLSDVSIEELGGALSRLSKNMVATSNVTSDQAQAFKALGISVRDSSGNLKSQNDILLAVADSFSKFRDGTTKTALAIAIFGRAGADMIPVLDKGAAGIKEMQDRMRELNPNLDADILSAEKFKDSLKELSIAKDAIILRLIGSSGLLQLFEQLAKNMSATAADGAKLAEISREIGTAIQVASTALQVFVDLLKIAATPSIAFAQALFQITQGNFSGALTAITDGFKGAVGSAKDAATAVEGLAKSATDFTYVGLSDELIKTALAQTQLANAPVFDPEAAKKVKQVTDEIQKLRDRALDISGVFAARLAPGFLAATANMEALKGQITIINGEFVKLGPLAQQFNQAMLQVQGQQIIQQTLPAWQQFEQQIIKNTTALRSLGLTADQIATINAKAAFNAGQSWEFAAQSIASSLAAGFAGFAQKNKELAGIAKAAAIAEAIANTYLAATKALATYPPPFGEIAAAASVVAGLGMVAKIQAQQFAKGGSFKVPGGVSGVDSMMVPLALSPGERVDITPSGQERDRGGRREIALTGIGPRDLFTGSMLRELFDTLNQGQRDGYRLKVAER